MLQPTSDPWPPGGADLLLEELQQRYIPSVAKMDLAGLLRERRLGRIAVVSSFGTESAVLLHYVAQLCPGLPVLFIDTGRHFPETLQYMHELAKEFGLDVTSIRPDPQMLQDEDPDQELWRHHPDTCCRVRKVFPLQDALAGFGCWITGRKRFQSTSRQTLPIIERDGALIKLNPLALWSAADVSTYARHHALPTHRLVTLGYASVGCEPCTSVVKAGEDARAGRWGHVPEKIECGIHLGPDGRFRRV